MTDNETNDRKRAEEIITQWSVAWDLESPPKDDERAIAIDSDLFDRIATFASEVRAEQRERDRQLCISATDDSKDGRICADAISSQKNIFASGFAQQS